MLDNKIYGYASDLLGNGESDAYNSPGNLIIDVVSGYWPAPTQMRISGAWNELWTLVRGTVYTPLPPVQRCGPYFVEYIVSSTTGAQGSGIRCLTNFDGIDNVWLGTGNWWGTSYTQLGLYEWVRDRDRDTLYSAQTPARGTVSDLCGWNFGQFCNATPTRALKITPQDPWEDPPYSYLFITGPWAEFWNRVR
jgi:hypothetical protein